MTSIPAPVNPGVIAYDEEYRKALKRFQEAVQKSDYLSKKQKENWGILGYSLSKAELLRAENLLIAEELRQLKVQSQLERLKPLSSKQK